MKYPDDFDSPAFPVGKPVAISRFMAIATMVVSLLVLFLCVLVVWGSRSQGIHPFLVSINPITGAWNVVGHNHGQTTITRSLALQESVLNRTFKNVFTISGDADLNSSLWDKCKREDCATRFLGDTEYGIYCSVSDELFDKFKSSIAEQNQMRFQSGERWNVVDMEMIPGTDVTNDQGRLWTIHARINSNITGIFNVVAYARISSNTQMYPHTMGFFVDTFNAYKISK